MGRERSYQKIPIVDTAMKCGLVIDSRTLRRSEVEASCPFCGDHGPGKHHLFLNTDTDQYHCILCGEYGNSVTLYARLKNLSNYEAYLDLARGGNIYPIPKQPESQYTEPQPRPLAERHAVYSDMLALPSLSEKHLENGANQQQYVPLYAGDGAGPAFVGLTPSPPGP